MNMISPIERLQIINALRSCDGITMETTVAELVEMGNVSPLSYDNVGYYKLNMDTIDGFLQGESAMEAMINSQIVTAIGDREFGLIEIDGNQMAIQNGTNLFPMFAFLFSDDEKEKYLIPVEHAVE